MSTPFDLDRLRRLSNFWYFSTNFNMFCNQQQIRSRKTTDKMQINRRFTQREARDFDEFFGLLFALLFKKGGWVVQNSKILST